MPSLRGPIVGLLISGILTFAIFMTARQIEAGTHLTYTGRRAASKQLLAEIAEALGTTGSLAVGLPVVAMFGLWLVLRIRRRNRLASAGAKDA